MYKRQLSGVHAQGFLRSASDIARRAAIEAGGRVVLYHDRGNEHQITAYTGYERLTHVEIAGGYTTLAKYLHDTTGRTMDRESVAEAIQALHLTPFAWHDGRTQWNTYCIGEMRHNDAGGRDNFLRFHLSGLFHPTYGAWLKSQGRPVNLVGVSLTLPPATSDRTSGPTAKLELAGLAHMRKHIHAWTPDGMPVPWPILAERAQLSRDTRQARMISLLERTLALWLDAGRWQRTGGGSALWEGHWRPTEPAQWEPLESAFRKTRKAREEGRRRRARRKR